MPRDDPALYATNTVEPINQPSDVIAIQRAEEKRQPIWGPSYYKLAMHIFIDESGTFIPNPLTPHKSGVMGAVVIPDSCLTEVFEAVDRLKTSSHWPTTDDGEIKGSLLNEKQIADLIAILRGRNITFTACCCDLSHYEADDLTQFQLAQSDALVRRVGLEHQSSLVRELLQVRSTSFCSSSSSCTLQFRQSSLPSNLRPFILQKWILASWDHSLGELMPRPSYQPVSRPFGLNSFH